MPRSYDVPKFWFSENSSSINSARLPIDFLNVFMHFSNVLFPKESENNNRFYEKKLFKKLFNFEVIFPIQHWRNSNFYNFLYIIHVNRIFYACIHDSKLNSSIYCVFIYHLTHFSHKIRIWYQFLREINNEMGNSTLKFVYPNLT